MGNIEFETGLFDGFASSECLLFACASHKMGTRAREGEKEKYYVIFDFSLQSITRPTTIYNNNNRNAKCFELENIPFSLKLASNQPQNKFFWFHSDSPWRTMTILYLPAILKNREIVATRKRNAQAMIKL